MERNLLNCQTVQIVVYNFCHIQPCAITLFIAAMVFIRCNSVHFTIIGIHLPKHVDGENSRIARSSKSAKVSHILRVNRLEFN